MKIDKNQLQEILERAGCEAIIDDSSFDKSFSDIGLDSLDFYNFITEIQVEFSKEISDQDYDKLKTLNDVFAFLTD